MKKVKLIVAIICLVLIGGIWGRYFYYVQEPFHQKLYGLFLDLEIERWKQFDDEAEKYKSQFLGSTSIVTSQFTASTRTDLSQDEKKDGKKDFEPSYTVHLDINIASGISALSELSYNSEVIMLREKPNMTSAYIFRNESGEYIPVTDHDEKMLLQKIENESGYTPEDIIKKSDQIRMSLLEFAEKQIQKDMMFYFNLSIFLSIAIVVAYAYLLRTKKLDIEISWS